jgi:hypothetical protein
MPTSLVGLQVLLILLPGFAAAYIVQLLALRGAQTDFDKAVEACLYSLLIYSVFILFTHGALPFEVVAPKPPATEDNVVWHPRMLWMLAGITVVFACGMTAYINLDGNRLFRWMRLTERTARRSIWTDVFQSEAKAQQIVQVELDGRSVQGVLAYYSDEAKDCSLYLEQASGVTEDGDAIPIPGPGILLTKSAGIKSISFLDPPA